MPVIRFEDRTLECAGDENLLQCLLRHEVNITYSCRSGACQSCLMQIVSGEVSSRSQAGLRDTLKEDRYVLACQCVPSNDMEVALPRGDGIRADVVVESLALLNDAVMSVRVLPQKLLTYRAGQFFNIVHEGVARSYSAASVPGIDECLEFHVARIPGGRISGWVHHELQRGDTVTLMGPHGHCFYTPGDTSQPLLLAGTGTGLAPLIGIAREALHRGHGGEIHLFHGALEAPGLYLMDTLRGMEEAHQRFHYHPCVLRGPAPAGVVEAPLDAFVFQRMPKLAGRRVYLCGHPDMVRLLQRKAFLAGASMKLIYADAFLPSAGAALRAADTEPTAIQL